MKEIKEIKKIKDINEVRKKRAGVSTGARRILGLIKIFALPFILSAPLLCRPIRALAAEANISFGSESYSKRNNEEFPIGVYIRGESKVGVYYVEVEYDADRMRYISGGDSEQDGVVILQGTGLRDEVKYMLRFQSVGGGEAGIRIRYAEVSEAVENGGGAFSIVSLDTAPITISGTDETGISFFDRIAAADAAAAESSEEEFPEEDSQSENGVPDEESGTPEGSGTPENGSSPEEGGEPGSRANPYGIDTDIPILTSVDTGDGQLKYVVDHAEYVPDTVTWDHQKVRGMFGGRQVTFLTNAEGTVRILYLMEEIVMDGIPLGERFLPYAYSSENGMLYFCHWTAEDEKGYLYMSPYACSVWPEELTLQAIAEGNVFFAMDMEGKGDFYQLNQDGHLVKWNPEASKVTASAQTRNLIYILAAAFAVMAAVSLCTYRAVKGKEKKKRQKQFKEKEESQGQQPDGEKEWKGREIRDPEDYDGDYEEDYDRDWDGETDSYSTYSEEDAEDGDTDWRWDEDIDDYDAEESSGAAVPVISVQNVTMIFHISTSNASGIKEYLIQWIKHQVTYREMKALDHISFDVFKGEVVGIIGTNGSGKSTLLRIVSGALNPTGGRVIVDRRKVQLLTLGTGFDMELSAKENVYLNGAIIGYSKEFLDAHYEEIVAFAELQEFMEEKVKNFSSGMVSRLGFAIATAGDAAEILILDEVLSVGDEFFKKKSLTRIKEMIHGGSTVLMVSHGMGTILENCTKVVWIEKGKLQMVGEAKEVCGAYEKAGEEIMNVS